MTEKRQPCASDSGVLPEPWPGTEQGVRQDKKKGKKNGNNHPKTRRRLSEHYEQSKDKDSNLMTPKNEELSRSGGGLNVNWPRPRLEIRLRYVGFPEETHWRCELAGIKSLVRLPSKSCRAPGEEEV